MIEDQLIQYGLAGAALVIMYKIYVMQHSLFKETIKALDRLSDAIDKLSREIALMKEDIRQIKITKQEEQMLKNLLKWEQKKGPDGDD